MGGFGLAGEHKNNLENAIPSKFVAGRGCEVPHRHLTTLQLQDLNFTASDGGVTTPEASILINMGVLMAIIR